MVIYLFIHLLLLLLGLPTRDSTSDGNKDGEQYLKTFDDDVFRCGPWYEYFITFFYLLFTKSFCSIYRI